MSIESLAVCLHHSQATGTDKLVLLGIANHDGDGGAWPAIATLAKYANATERTVQRCISRLVASGEIVRLVKQGGSVDQRDDLRTNKYLVKVACPPDCDRSTQHRIRGDRLRSSEVTSMAIEVTSMVERGDTGVTQTINEPSLEPSKETANALASHLASLIAENGSRKPVVGKQWIDEIDRMLRIDKRTEDEIRAMIIWSQADSFWRANILSPRKLRIHFDRMRLQRDTRKPAGGMSYFELANLETRTEIEK